MTTVDSATPAMIWEHTWDEALQRARSARRLLLIDVEKDE